MNSKIKTIIRKKNRSKIVCLTAYSKNIAEIIDNHVDIILVGDSLGSVLYNKKISNIDKKKSKTLEKKDSTHKNDTLTLNNQAKSNKSEILVLDQMIE